MALRAENPEPEAFQQELSTPRPVNLYYTSCLLKRSSPSTTTSFLVLFLAFFPSSHVLLTPRLVSQVLSGG